MSKYRDKRSDFFRGFFEKAVNFDRYLVESDENHRLRWIEMDRQLKLSSELAKITRSFIRKMNVLVMSGIWCGDCSRQGPMLQAIAQSNCLIDLRFIDSKSNPELEDELRINGATKVPVVVVLSEDFFEVARFGDRHLSVYRTKAEKELGPACDPGILPPDEAELNQELSEWVEWFERAHLVLRLAPLLRQRHGD
jgi:thiol-disulfide isomerase/thioredoxin